VKITPKFYYEPYKRKTVNGSRHYICKEYILPSVTTILSKKVTPEEINAAMKAASNESFGYNEDEIVSTDIIGTHFGSLFDATQTKVMTVGDTQMVKTVSWYDNEMSYVSQLVRTVNYFAGLINK
jgi:glyceraldehyde 3-phosphate dehydrogenase